MNKKKKFENSQIILLSTSISLIAISFYYVLKGEFVACLMVYSFATYFLGAFIASWSWKSEILEKEENKK